MKNLSLFVVLFFATVPLFSQERGSQALTTNPSVKINPSDSRGKEIVGSTYINDTYVSSKNSFDDIVYFVRYDAYNDQMEVNDNAKSYVLKSLGLQLHLENKKTYQVFLESDKKKEEPHFFVVLSKNDDISLLSKERIKFFKEKVPDNSYEKYIPPRYKRVKDQFYVGIRNKFAKKISRKKKVFLSIFNDKKQLIKKYMKKNRLSHKKKKDLMKIFNYYNTL